MSQTATIKVVYEGPTDEGGRYRYTYKREWNAKFHELRVGRKTIQVIQSELDLETLVFAISIKRLISAAVIYGD